MSKITRREFGKKMALGAAGIAALNSGVQNLDAMPSISMKDKNMSLDSKKPNFVFISSDQHSFRFAGFMGHPFVKTPNMDKIAARGVVLENNYSGNPVCVPARACMMTGMYPSDLDSFGNTTVYDGAYPTWGKRLRDLGYYCWGTGKADLNDKFDLGFDGKLVNGHSEKPDITELFRRPTIYRIDERNVIKGESREEPSRDQAQVKKSVDFIRNKSVYLNKPWAAYVGFHMPHPNFIGLKKYYDYYLPLAELPYTADDYLESLPLPYQVLRHFKRIATPIPKDRIIRARAAYYSMISELDDFIGDIFDAVESTGQLDNTYFIYTTDHGEALGYNGLWLKNNLYEGAAHIPVVFCGPGLPKGKRVQQPTGHIDLVATMMEWAGLDKIKELRGKSLTPFINGESKGGPEYAYTESHSEGNIAGSFMVRIDEWKLMHFTWYGNYLFNLKEDPNEFKNLIDDPKYKDKAKELSTRLHNLVDTEKITMRAFEAQNKYLSNFNKKLSNDEFIKMLKGRLGEGQARYLVDKLKKGMLC